MYTIGVDVDEVLCSLLPSLIDYYNINYGGRRVEEYGNISLKSCDITHFTRDTEFEGVWGCSYKIAFDILNNYLMTDTFLNLKPMEHSVDVLQSLAERYRLVVITNRHTSLHEHTKTFLNKHYGDIFSGIYLGNEYGLDNVKYTKIEMCQQAGVDVLIDDSPKNVIGVAKYGLPVILFGKYPWNRMEEHEINTYQIEHVESWNEIPQAIENLLIKKNYNIS